MHHSDTHRRPLVMLLVLALLLPLIVVGQAPPAAAADFEDVGPSNVFAADIAAIAAAGITKGCNPPTNTRFCPDAPVTRQQMAAFLNRALPLPAANENFVDVGPSNVFAADIAAIAAAGITKGCNPPTNTRFCPDAPVTRQQMAAFLNRAGFADPAPDPDPTPDPTPDPNQAPTISVSAQDDDLVEGTDVTIAISATDPDGDEFDLTVSGTLPGGLMFDGTSTISGTPAVGTSGGSPYAVTVTATDDQGNSNQTTFEITVAEKANEEPTIDPIADFTVPELGLVGPIPVGVNDPDDQPQPLSVQVDGLPTGVTHFGDSISGSPNPGTAGTYPVTVTADDGAGITKRLFTLTVTGPNQPPTITNPGDQTAELGQPFDLELEVTDDEGDDFSVDVGPLPDGLDFDANSATISGTPNGDAGETVVFVTAEQTGGQQSQVTFTIDVIEHTRSNSAGASPGPRVRPVGLA